jgi:hypothetical protein
MQRFRGFGGECFFENLAKQPGGQALIDRETVVPYQRPKRAVPTRKKQVTDDMLILCRMSRSDFIALGAGALAAVVLLLAAARKAGELTQQDRDDDLAAAHASTETSGHGGTKGANDLSYAILTWVNFYDVAGIESRIEYGEYGKGFSLALHGPTTRMAEMYVAYLMTSARQRFDYSEPEFHGLRSGTVASLVSMMASHGFSTLYPESVWADDTKRDRKSQEWHADCHRAADQQRSVWALRPETQQLDSIYTSSQAKEAFSHLSWSAMCDTFVSQGPLGVLKASVFAAIVGSVPRSALCISGSIIKSSQVSPLQSRHTHFSHVRHSTAHPL